MAELKMLILRKIYNCVKKIYSDIFVDDSWIKPPYPWPDDNDKMEKK